MTALGQVVAHGGIRFPAPPPKAVHAILRGTDRTIRVWNGVAGKREEFTIDEARALCARADAALTARTDGREAGLWLDDGGALRPLIVSRDWLVAFVVALRGALKTWDRACALAEGARQ